MSKHKFTPRAPSVHLITASRTGVNSSNASLADATTVDDALSKLSFAAANLASTGQPFFLGVGIQKPHLGEVGSAYPL